MAVASAAGHRGLWHLAAYITAKHAVVGLVLGLAADLRGTGVTATAVSPGSTRTPMLSATAALYDLADPEELIQDQLVERLLEPGEVAAAICWLCCRAVLRNDRISAARRRGPHDVSGTGPVSERLPWACGFG